MRTRQQHTPDRASISDYGPPSLREAYLMGREHLAAAGIADAQIEAEVLLRYAAGLDRSALYARWTQPPGEAAWQRYLALLQARAAGRPVAYLVGEREFYGLPLWVDERVLIPRPETEMLVDVVLDAVRDVVSPVLVDVGTGSGAVAIALAVQRPDLRVWATDISEQALEVARVNAERHGVADRIGFLAGDALIPVVERSVRVHAVVANPPYIPPHALGELPTEIRDHEPAVALLAPGPNGTEMHERIASQARQVLCPGGTLVMEVAARWGQAEAVAEMLSGLGFADVQVRCDLSGLERVVLGRLAR